MPLYKILQPNLDTVLKIWKITESLEYYMQTIKLKPESLNRVNGMKSELHQRGFLSIRMLLAEFGYSDEDLFYNDDGKPFLRDGKYISITHSYTFSAIIISEHPVGIDIEKQRDKITKIAHKYTDYECDYLNTIDVNYVRKLTVIWCVKEALYKLFSVKGLSFKQHIFVLPFHFDETTTCAWIDYQSNKYRYKADYLEFEGFSCSYTLPS